MSYKARHSSPSIINHQPCQSSIMSFIHHHCCAACSVCCVLLVCPVCYVLLVHPVCCVLWSLLWTAVCPSLSCGLCAVLCAGLGAVCWALGCGLCAVLWTH